MSENRNGATIIMSILIVGIVLVIGFILFQLSQQPGTTFTGGPDDNCCGEGDYRGGANCVTDQEWIDGYNACQSGGCSKCAGNSGGGDNGGGDSGGGNSGGGGNTADCACSLNADGGTWNWNCVGCEGGDFGAYLHHCPNMTGNGTCSSCISGSPSVSQARSGSMGVPDCGCSQFDVGHNGATITGACWCLPNSCGGSTPNPTPTPTPTPTPPPNPPPTPAKQNCGEGCSADSDCLAEHTCTGGKCVYNPCLTEGACEDDGCTPLVRVECGEACDANNDCPNDHVCSDGICKLPECLVEGNCTDGSCTPVNKCGDTCGTNADCPNDHTCSSGYCRLTTCLADPESCDVTLCEPILPETAIISDEVDRAIGGFILIILSLVAFRMQLLDKIAISTMTASNSIAQSLRLNVLPSSMLSPQEIAKRKRGEREEFERKLEAD